jgi:hypothetical protein
MLEYCVMRVLGVFIIEGLKSPILGKAAKIPA